MSDKKISILFAWKPFEKRIWVSFGCPKIWYKIGKILDRIEYEMSDKNRGHIISYKMSAFYFDENHS